MASEFEDFRDFVDGIGKPPKSLEKTFNGWCWACLSTWPRPIPIALHLANEPFGDAWDVTLLMNPLPKTRRENVSGIIYEAIADWLDSTSGIIATIDGDETCRSILRTGWFEKRQVLELFEVFRREGAVADASNATFNQFWLETTDFGDWFWMPEKDDESRKRIGLILRREKP